MAEQIPLAIPPAEDAELVLSAANHRARQYLQTSRWPQPVLILVGPVGSGKRALIEAAGFRWVKAEEIGEVIAADLAGDFAIQGLGSLVADKAGAEALFHLYNFIHNRGGRLAILSETAPAVLNIPLADLRTRLNAAEIVTIGDPDDATLPLLIVKEFHRRGVNVSAEVVEYLAQHSPRDYAGIAATVAAIDARARITQVRITKRFVKQVLAAL